MFRHLTVFVLVGFVVGGLPAPRASGADAKNPIVLEGHTAGVPAVAFVGDGKVLATGSQDKTIKLWNVAEGKEVATLKGHTNGVQSVTASRNGKILVSADEGVVKVWDIVTLKELFTLKGLKGDAPALVISPDDKAVAVGGGGLDKATEKGWGEIRMWDLTTGKELAVFNWSENRVNSIAFSPDGALLAACSSNGSVSLWDVATSRKKTDPGKNPQGGTGLAFSPDGKTLACGNFVRQMTIKFWDVTSGKEVRTLESKANVSAFSLKYLPDGKTLAVGGFDTEGLRDPNVRGSYVALWDIEGGKEHRLTGHLRGVISITVNRDGTRLAAGGLDKNVHVWELPAKDK
jgi:WD40 repeat protein